LTAKGDRGAHLSHGCGFITFKTVATVEAALSFTDPIEIVGRTILTWRARPPQTRKRDTADTGGIPEETTEENLKAAFTKYNPISVRLVQFDKGQRKGFTFVQFGTKENADGDLREKLSLKGSSFTVRWIRPPQRNDFGYGRGGRQGQPRRVPAPPPSGLHAGGGTRVERGQLLLTGGSIGNRLRMASLEIKWFQLERSPHDRGR
jgi:hypothetical protein